MGGKGRRHLVRGAEEKQSMQQFGTQKKGIKQLQMRRSRSNQGDEASVGNAKCEEKE